MDIGPRPTTVPSGRITWRGGTSPLPASVPRAPASTFGFDALPRIGGHWPGDPTGAVGDGWFFAAVNTSNALYDRAGQPIIGPNALRGLFALPGRAEVFHPKVVYDLYLDTFVLAFLAVDALERRSWILLVAIPDVTANDPSTWCGALVKADRTAGDGRQFADYPGLGFDLERVVVTASRFDVSGGAFRGAMALAFPKARLYDCDRSLTFETFVGPETRNPDGGLAFTVQPATTVGAGAVLYLVSFDTGLANSLILWRMREGRVGLALDRAAIRDPRVRIGPFGTQGGGSRDRSQTWWDPGDLRLVNAFADLDRRSVYAAHVVARDLEPDIGEDYLEATIRWYEIHPAIPLRASTVTRFGTVGEVETDAGWPAVATDATGNLFITYSRASVVTHEFLSAWVAEVTPGPTVAETQPVRSGTARMEAVDGVERWGGYAAAGRDPTDGDLVAIVNQFAVADSAGPTTDWRQAVYLIRHV
jgi:hypothetical protein